MAENSAIQWTDHTFNPWRGCSKVHTGCKNCYAEKNYSIKMHGIKWGTEAQGGTRVKLADAGWKEPLKWDRAAAAAGERRRVFCASLADVFEQWDGPVLDHHGQRLKKPFRSGACDVTLDDLRRDLFALIDATPNLDWLLLTKRPDNVRRMWFGRERRRNVWLGTSISDQETADRMLPELLKCRDLARVLFVSAEPLVGPVNLIRLAEEHGLASPGLDGIDWLIIGGESGGGARDCDISWVRSLVAQCRDCAVPVFVKQLGARPCNGELRPNLCSGRVCGFNDPKGGDPAEWPEDLRVRELPR